MCLFGVCGFLQIDFAAYILTLSKTGLSVMGTPDLYLQVRAEGAVLGPGLKRLVMPSLPQNRYKTLEYANPLVVWARGVGT